MNGTFEDSMQEILESMLSVCLEYGEHRVDGVYLYGAAEDGTSSADVFYDIGGHLYRTNQLNDAPAAGSGQPFDLSDSRGSACWIFSWTILIAYLNFIRIMIGNPQPS